MFPLQRCRHSDLSEADRDRKWLTPGSLPVKKVELAICGRGDSRLRDLGMMTIFAHTRPNEALNALHNKVNNWKEKSRHRNVYIVKHETK